MLLAWANRSVSAPGGVESAGGLGYLLSRQLVGAGEQVLDVPAILPSRVRVLGTGKSNKNDPNDSLSVAIAALRSPGLRSVAGHSFEICLSAAVPTGRQRKLPGSS